MLAAWGCDVTSLDVPGRPKYERSYFSVQDYDGSAIPFPDGTFDVVFSSNVLEHVREPAALVRETRRVLKRGGIAVHLMPSTAWRFWTSVAHYVYLAKYIAGKREVASAPAAPTAAAVVRRRGWRYLFWRALLAGPHGEYSNAVAELYYFSSRRWSRLLRDNGFQVEVVAPSGLFYTGYSLLPALPVGMRRRLSTFLGSACNIFVVAPVPDPLPGGSSSFEKTGSDGSTPEIRPMREQRQ
jgi:SAM-dependent methyltransferase